MGINDTKTVENVTKNLESAAQNAKTSGDLKVATEALESIAVSRMGVNATVSTSEVTVSTDKIYN